MEGEVRATPAASEDFERLGHAGLVQRHLAVGAGVPLLPLPSVGE